MEKLYSNTVAPEAGQQDTQRLAMLFMRGVEDRYLILLRLGLPLGVVREIDLDGTPILAALRVGKALEARGLDPITIRDDDLAGLMPEGFHQYLGLKGTP